MDRSCLINQLKKVVKQFNIKLDEDILEIIADNAAFHVFKKGDIMRNISEKTETAALVLDGICRCYYIDEYGNDITRGFAVPGSLCMDEGLLGYVKSTVTWVTLEKSTVMLFNVAKIKKIIFDNEQLKNVYIMILETSLRYKIYRENGFLVENATERYLHFKKMYPTICDTVKQHYIATYLGIKPESLSRIRKALKEDKIGALPTQQNV